MTMIVYLFKVWRVPQQPLMTAGVTAGHISLSKYSGSWNKLLLISSHLFSKKIRLKKHNPDYDFFFSEVGITV